MNSLQLFQILQQKIGAKEAEALVSFVDAKITEQGDTNLKILATKDDIGKVREEMANNKGELTTKISETKSEILRWMFVFWATQITATIAFLMIYLKK